jgi:hypothetical protein
VGHDLLLDDILRRSEDLREEDQPDTKGDLGRVVVRARVHGRDAQDEVGRDIGHRNALLERLEMSVPAKPTSATPSVTISSADHWYR